MTNRGSEIRIGLIGCGRIARVHLRHLRALPQVRVAAVCDVDAERARAFAAEAEGAEAVSDVDALLRAGLDAVHVLTPPTSHADTAVTALERGMHVLVEKPMATTAAAAARMQTAAAAARRLVCVDHNRLFDPVIVRARQMIETGALGTLVSAEAYQGVNVQEGGPAAAPLAMWLNLAPHPLYLLRAFIGEIGEWHALAGPLGEIRAVLRGGRALGFLCFSPGATPYLNALTLHGTKATLHIDLNTMTLVQRRTRRLPSMLAKAALNVDVGMQLFASTARTTLQVATGRMGTYPGIGEVVRRFYEAVATGGPAPVGAEDGHAVVTLLEGLWDRTHGAAQAARARRPPAAPPAPGGRLVLVTGASGYLGRRVVDALAVRGHQVRAMVRFPCLDTESERVEEVAATLGDAAAMAAALQGVEVVVHCAARVARRGSRDDFLRDNVDGTRSLLEAAARAGVERFVHVSSIAVYGVERGLERVAEDAAYDPHPDWRGAYTESKLEADRLVLERGPLLGLRTVVLRPGILVGAGGPEFTARLTLGRLRGRVLIVGRPGQRLPLCHVDDVARAAALAVTAPAACGAYNVVDDVLTQREWLRERAAAGWPFRPLYVPPAVAALPALALEGAARVLGRGRPAFSRYRVRRATENVRFDVARAARDLGWTPEIGVARLAPPGPPPRLRAPVAGAVGGRAVARSGGAS
jgi:nucleoside-diphosphate-sugar epimerase/predicted dehydrogenase